MGADNVLSPCPHIQRCAPGHPVNGFPLPADQPDTLGCSATAARHWSLSAWPAAVSPPYDTPVNLTSAVADVATAWMHSHWGIDEGIKHAFFIVKGYSKCVCVKEYQRNTGCVRDIITRHVCEGVRNTKCVYKWLHIADSVFTCVCGEAESFLCPILCSVSSCNKEYHALCNEGRVVLCGCEILCPLCLTLHCPAL